MESRFVRLNAYDPRRGHVLRRLSYKGIRFDSDRRAWIRVPAEVGEYLRTVHQVPGDEYTPLAFEVAASDAEARAIDARQGRDHAPPEPVSVDTQLTLPRTSPDPVDGARARRAADAPAGTEDGKPASATAGSPEDKDNRRAKRERE